jgi:hypothetical protein
VEEIVKLNMMRHAEDDEKTSYNMTALHVGDGVRAAAADEWRMEGSEVQRQAPKSSI